MPLVPVLPCRLAEGEGVPELEAVRRPGREEERRRRAAGAGPLLVVQVATVGRPRNPRRIGACSLIPDGRQSSEVG